MAKLVATAGQMARWSREENERGRERERDLDDLSPYCVPYYTKWQHIYVYMYV